MYNFDILDVLHSGKYILTDTICRMCLKPSSSMISIFNKIVIETESPVSPKTSQTIRILDLFEYFMPIKICDMFSNMVCNVCIKNAQDVFIFKARIQEVDSWLIQNVNNLKMVKCDGKKTREFHQTQKQQIYKISKIDNDSSKENTSLDSQTFKNKVFQTKIDVPVDDTTNKNTKAPETSMAIENSITDLPVKNKIIEIPDNDSIDQRNSEAVKKSLPEHLKDHDYDLIFCDFCDQYFPDQYSYNQHDKIHTIKKSKCNICNVYFSRKTGYTQHMKIHARKAALHKMPVNINDAFFPFEMNSEGEKSITCKLCGETFKQFRSIERHMRIAHLKGFIFGCHFCGEGFNIRLSLMEHLKSHITFDPYSCAHCPKTFNKMADITNHVKIHKVDQLLTNDIEKTDETSQKLEDNELFICSFCGKTMSDQKKLTLHFKIHTGEKAFLCQLCGKAFVTSAQLTVHLRVHDVNKFECKICGQTYKQPQTLKEHMKSHSNENKDKFYDCTLCDKRFKLAPNLRLHMKYHNNEDLFQCTICEKAFVTRSRLKFHLKMHSNERPYTCRYCNKDFKTRFNLRYHENAHQGIKPYVCNICDMAFARRYGLMQHTIKKHQISKSQYCALFRNSAKIL